MGKGAGGGEGGFALLQVGLLCHYLMVPTVLNSILLQPLKSIYGPC